ncbi:MAG: hypothetical protein Q7S22_08805, partial [Candidatus Micrarchaeota archaeon]|nr:hypothetical protein [Candidatus Micrarchaeota archaeon]
MVGELERLANIKFSKLPVELQSEIRELATEISPETTISSKTKLETIYAIFKSSKRQKSKRAEKLLKKAERQILDAHALRRGDVGEAKAPQKIKKPSLIETITRVALNEEQRIVQRDVQEGERKFREVLAEVAKKPLRALVFIREMKKLEKELKLKHGSDAAKQLRANLAATNMPIALAMESKEIAKKEFGDDKTWTKHLSTSIAISAAAGWIAKHKPTNIPACFNDLSGQIMRLYGLLNADYYDKKRIVEVVDITLKIFDKFGQHSHQVIAAVLGAGFNVNDYRTRDIYVTLLETSTRLNNADEVRELAEMVEPLTRDGRGHKRDVFLDSLRLTRNLGEMQAMHSKITALKLEEYRKLPFEACKSREDHGILLRFQKDLEDMKGANEGKNIFHELHMAISWPHWAMHDFAALKQLYEYISSSVGCQDVFSTTSDNSLFTIIVKELGLKEPPSGASQNERDKFNEGQAAKVEEAKKQMTSCLEILGSVSPRTAILSELTALASLYGVKKAIAIINEDRKLAGQIEQDKTHWVHGVEVEVWGFNVPNSYRKINVFEDFFISDINRHHGLGKSELKEKIAQDRKERLALLAYCDAEFVERRSNRVTSTYRVYDTFFKEKARAEVLHELDALVGGKDKNPLRTENGLRRISGSELNQLKIFRDIYEQFPQSAWPDVLTYCNHIYPLADSDFRDVAVTAVRAGIARNGKIQPFELGAIVNFAYRVSQGTSKRVKPLETLDFSLRLFDQITSNGGMKQSNLYKMFQESKTREELLEALDNIGNIETAVGEGVNHAYSSNARDLTPEILRHAVNNKYGLPAHIALLVITNTYSGRDKSLAAVAEIYTPLSGEERKVFDRLYVSYCRAPIIRDVLLVFDWTSEERISIVRELSRLNIIHPGMIYNQSTVSDLGPLKDLSYEKLRDQLRAKKFEFVKYLRGDRVYHDGNKVPDSEFLATIEPALDAVIDQNAPGAIQHAINLQSLLSKEPREFFEETLKAIIPVQKRLQEAGRNTKDDSNIIYQTAFDLTQKYGDKLSARKKLEYFVACSDRLASVLCEKTSDGRFRYAALRETGVFGNIITVASTYSEFDSPEGITTVIDTINSELKDFQVVHLPLVVRLLENAVLINVNNVKVMTGAVSEVVKYANDLGLAVENQTTILHLLCAFSFHRPADLLTLGKEMVKGINIAVKRGTYPINAVSLSNTVHTYYLQPNVNGPDSLRIYRDPRLKHIVDLCCRAHALKERAGTNQQNDAELFVKELENEYLEGGYVPGLLNIARINETRAGTLFILRKMEDETVFDKSEHPELFFRLSTASAVAAEYIQRRVKEDIPLVAKRNLRSIYNALGQSGSASIRQEFQTLENVPTIAGEVAHTMAFAAFRTEQTINRVSKEAGRPALCAYVLSTGFALNAPGDVVVKQYLRNAQLRHDTWTKFSSDSAREKWRGQMSKIDKMSNGRRIKSQAKLLRDIFFDDVKKTDAWENSKTATDKTEKKKWNAVAYLETARKWMDSGLLEYYTYPTAYKVASGAGGIEEGSSAAKITDAIREACELAGADTIIVDHSTVRTTDHPTSAKGNIADTNLGRAIAQILDRIVTKSTNPEKARANSGWLTTVNHWNVRKLHLRETDAPHFVGLNLYSGIEYQSSV